MALPAGFEGVPPVGTYYFLRAEEPLDVQLIFVGVRAWEPGTDSAWARMRAWLKANTAYRLKDGRMGGHLSATTISFADAAEKAAYVAAFDNGARYDPRAPETDAFFAL